MERSTEYLHPTVRPMFEMLVGQMADAFDDQKVTVLFRPFETYRSPFRQRQLYLQGRQTGGKVVTNADAWQSAHQYGLAMDMVPYQRRVGSGLSGFAWSWDAPKSDWDFLHEKAKRLGFNDRLPWDSPHIEHHMFTDYKTLWNWEKQNQPPF